MVPPYSDRITRVPPYSSLVINFAFCVRGYHPLWRHFPEASANTSAKARRLVPFRSPLLRESRLISVPLVTEMFQFSRFAPALLWIQSAVTLAGRVSPFGNQRIKAHLPAPRCLSQAVTSFVAYHRQGIHHVHLVACPYNVDLWDTAIPKTLQQHAVCTTVDACLFRYNHNPSAHPHLVKGEAHCEFNLSLLLLPIC